MFPTFLLTYRKTHPRLTNHYGLALFSLLGCILARYIGGPDQPILETISLGTAYVALLLVLLTLVIGPINMLKKRKNPVNMMFRRDAGIWAGITAILHMVSSFTLYFGGNLLLYFFQDNGSGLSFSFDLFYLSDYLGLIAGLVILFLLVLSNNYFLKFFKGPKWKQFQRFNYLLFVVALLHTLGQQLTNSRNLVLTFGVIALAGLVVIAQSIGFVVYRRRDQQRKAASTGSTATPRRALPKNEVAPDPSFIPAPSMGRNMPLQPAYAAAPLEKGLGRRRFLLVTGTVMLSGVVGGLSAKVIAKSNETGITTASNSSGVVASNSENSTAAQTTSGASQSTAAISTATATATSAATTASSAAPTTAAATTASATAATPASAATTSAVTSTSAATTAATTGTVLATIANLAAGKAVAVTTPDTKAAAFLIHRQDGSVACFSGICTHEPVKLTFNEAQQYLYCPKHGVPFDIQTGAPERGPARTALAKYNVTVDSQGQVIYG